MAELPSPTHVQNQVFTEGQLPVNAPQLPRQVECYFKGFWGSFAIYFVGGRRVIRRVMSHHKRDREPRLYSNHLQVSEVI